MIQNPADGSCAERALGSGSARRRRERRLRSWLRHERMTVRMELAAGLHHSSFRGAGPETHDAPRSQRTANSREEAVFFELYDEDTAGWRPAPLPEVAGPQAQVLQRTMEPIVDAVPLVPLLDDPVPQTVEQLPDVLQFFGTLTSDPEQVIEVPKIFTEDVPMRAVLRATQLAEQLVEVPTIISYSSLFQQTMEQIVDIPVRGCGGRNVDLQGFLPGQGSTAPFLSLERISEQIVEQTVDDPVPSGGGRRGCRRRIRIWPKLARTVHEILAVSRPGQSSAAFPRAEQETLGGSRPGRSFTAFGAAEHETLAGFLPGQGSPAFHGTQYGFLPGSSSTASGVPVLQHLWSRSSWTKFRCG